jgi:hypothetical protein
MYDDIYHPHFPYFFSEAIQINISSGDLRWDFWGDFAFTNRLEGSLYQAGELLSQAVRRAGQPQGVYQGNLGRVEEYLCSVLLEQNKLSWRLPRWTSKHI